MNALDEAGTDSAQAPVASSETTPKQAACQWSGTYRLQMHKGFTLDDARDMLPYLAQLNISHVYLSPCLKAAAGSTHGYDVTDASVINPELGGEAAWDRFVDATHAQGLKVLLDIVPNHMAVSGDNRWWNDVLVHGPFSDFVDYFDIRRASDERFEIQLCTLGTPYGDALESGELCVVIAAGKPYAKYGDALWPLSPSSYGKVLLFAGHADGAHSVCFEELVALRSNPRPDLEARGRWRDLVDEALAIFAREMETKAPTPESLTHDPATVHEVLQCQFFALHDWTLSAERTNYRRFFEVNSLIGVRTELPAVMQATHARIQQMIARGDLDGLRIDHPDGLRIDHPDGLRDPQAYFDRLKVLLTRGRIYVEKILGNDEQLLREWPVDGTVGYDFLAKVNRLWMDDGKIDALTSIYADFTGHSVNINALVRQKQRDILEGSFYADIERLMQQLSALARNHWRTSDLNLRHLREALARVTAALPIYRTYRTQRHIHALDQRVIADTVQTVRMSAPHLPPAVFEFLEDVLSRPQLTVEEADFVLKWQQLTPAVMAKGVEDTTFYCFDRLLSCNEVGASASLLGISSDKFHEYSHYLSESWPRNLLATSTHDNKRSEDVRTRISVLSEIPDKWADALHRWSLMNAEAWQNRTPDRHAEYLLYQTLIGAWPINPERTWEYMLKASREAKIHTSWHQPNHDYEEKLRLFTEGVFNNADFLASLEQFVTPLVAPGRINSLAQTLIKMTAPGVPDFYQGSELWDLSLVDPDNRRPVDYQLRTKLLAQCEYTDASAAMGAMESGLPKIWMIHRILQLRARQCEDFGPSSTYQPLVARGSHLGNLLSYRRGDNVLIVVPRLTMSMAGEWGDTSLPLPRGAWINLFTGQKSNRSVRPARLFAEFPVALLMRSSSG